MGFSISSMSSISIVCPLVFLVYLLTADWVIPRISATWFCFMPYFSKSCLAINALIAGITDFTATSHGVSKIYTVLPISVGKVYKDDVCHSFMTYVMTGQTPQNWLLNRFSHLSPSSRQDTRQRKGTQRHENRKLSNDA